MDPDSKSFKAEDWISCGKKWADCPPYVRRTAAWDFDIPLALQDKLLPSRDLSIRDMLNFSVPTASVNRVEKSLDDFFRPTLSHNLNSDTIVSKLRRLTIPPTKIVNQLVEASRQAWLDGHRSVVYAHLGDATVTMFPLWVVTYWVDIVKFRATARDPWGASKTWLSGEMKQKKSTVRMMLAEEVNELLHVLPWNAQKSGVSDKESTHLLSQFLGTRYLTGSAMNDLLEILRERVVDDKVFRERQVRVEHVSLTSAVMRAFAQRNDAHSYAGTGFSWIRMVGEKLFGAGQELVTIAHLRGITDVEGDPENHWVALVVDAKANMIRYGDPLGSPMPRKLFDAYTWWIAQHSTSIFSTARLEITRQSDSHSCGPLSINALEHYVFNGTALVESKSVREERMRLFKVVADRVLDSVSFDPIRVMMMAYSSQLLACIRGFHVGRIQWGRRHRPWHNLSE